MAILSDLVETIAKVEGLDVASVGLIARHIREAGLIATHGRGPSAARMGPSDAANLLIGVNATSSAADAPRVVKAYRRLYPFEFRFPARSDPDPSEPQSSSLLKRIITGHADRRPESGSRLLGNAIEQLLTAAGRGELPDPFIGQELGSDFQEAFARGDVRIDLRFHQSAPAAFLAMTKLSRMDATEPIVADLYLAIVPPLVGILFRPLEPRAPPPEKKKPTVDRIQETTIGYPTLRAVGKLIA